jgi:tRNA pseudouridine65 synthase
MDAPAALPLGPGARLLARHPSGLIALDKPPGLLSHPNDRASSGRALIQASFDAAAECYQLPDGGALHLLHRLDSATSGVILLCADARLAATVRRLFAAGGVEKTYLALVFGVPRARRETWSDRLSIQRQGGKLRTSAVSGGGEEARCEMRCLKTLTGNPVTSLLELRPGTGRTHQLRVQCQRRGLPIVGDSTYGDFNKNRLRQRAGGSARLHLHAWQVSLSVHQQGRLVDFSAESEPPAEFGL